MKRRRRVSQDDNDEKQGRLDAAAMQVEDWMAETNIGEEGLSRLEALGQDVKAVLLSAKRERNPYEVLLPLQNL